MAKKLFSVVLFITFLPQLAMAQRIQYNVPFVSQAPRGNWKDAVFRDACEETSLLMAEAWILGAELDPVVVESRLHELATYEMKRFGFHQDTSIADTYLLATEYLHLPASLTENISTDDIQKALEEKNIVIVGINASKIYRNGPTRHTIVITGFDKDTDRFYYNDPMKAQGKNLSIDKSVLQQILRDYPSGVHKLVTSSKTAMIKIGWPWLLPPN